MRVSEELSASFVSTSHALALAVGALLTPVAMGLSLQVLPVGAPMLVYALVGGGFAFRYPEESWQWGLWAAGGLLLAFLVVLLATPIVTWWLESSVDLRSVGEFAKIWFLLGFTPGLAGGCLGAISGSLLARGYIKQSAALVAFTVGAAIIAGFIG